MKFNRLDHVRRKVDNTFWDGLVLAYVQRLKGGYVILVERFDGMMFICTDDQLELMRPYNIRKMCQHSAGFNFKPTPPRWECELGCGYSLNFNPEFMDGIAFTEAKPGPTIDLKPSKY